jgi:hypothetical protein
LGFQAEARLEDARQACTEALRLMEKSEGPDSPDVVNLLNDLTDIETEHQNFARRWRWRNARRRSPAIWATVSEEKTPARIRLKTLELLGTIRRTLGDYAQPKSI